MSLKSQENIRSTPLRFPWRTLGIPGDAAIAITEQLQIVLPRSWIKSDEQWRIRCCERMKELGFNAIVFYAVSSCKNEKADIKPLFTTFQSQGIKVFVQPQLCNELVKSPANHDYRTMIDLSLRDLLRHYPQLEGIFWQSTLHQSDYFAHVDARDALPLDLILLELATVEKALSGQKMLIFSVPSGSLDTAHREVLWLDRLCDDAGAGTCLAFSAVAGDPTWDHLPPHPFWEKLRMREEPVVTPLLPIVNTGGVGQGEGLWPSISFDLFENFFNRLRHHNFCGVMNLSGQIPEGHGVLACNLWVAGKLLESEEVPEWMMEEWFRVYKKSWPYAQLRQAMRQMRTLVIEISRLKYGIQDKARRNIASEEYRVLFDSLSLQFKQLQVSANRWNHKHAQKEPSLKDYLEYFARDGRRLMRYFAQLYNVGTAQLWAGEEKGESFWTSGQAGANVKLLQEPMNGSPESSMESIFRENRML